MERALVDKAITRCKGLRAFRRAFSCGAHAQLRWQHKERMTRDVVVALRQGTTDGLPGSLDAEVVWQACVTKALTSGF